MNILQIVIDWSEVWAVLIPLLIFLRYPKQPGHLYPVIVYLWVALVLNTIADCSWYFKDEMPYFLKSNNYIYNLHSILRLICFGVFFTYLKETFLRRGRAALLVISLILITLNFLFAENFWRFDVFSSRLFAFESGLILFYCLQYFIYRLVHNDTLYNKRPEVWIIIGLSVYVIFNFPFFLFYTSLFPLYKEFAVAMWNFHNLTYIICCVFFARALYVPRYQ
jgi:hypothetical protein